MLANRLIRFRLEVELSERRGWARGHPRYRSRRRLQQLTKVFDLRLTSVQRVQDRFGGHKKPTELSIQVEKAKTMKEISTILTGILDTLRFMV